MRPLVFTWQAAVVAAIVHSAPLLIESARAALESVDHSHERAARSLGASEWKVFWKVSLPLAWNSILAATALAFARSLGDFGVTIMLAGNIPGRTQTVAVAIYDAVESGQGAVGADAGDCHFRDRLGGIDSGQPGGTELLWAGQRMIEVRIRKSFSGGKDSVPFTIDVEFRSAARTAVLFGPSGAGKTLTLDAIAGFVQPDEGRILVDDVLLFDGAAGVRLTPQQRRCGYVFQNYALFPHMSLRENLGFAAERLPRLERRRRVAEMLELFQLTELAGRRPHELSGGQKQRCSIARALIAEPKLLLLDEPARGLDPQLRAALYAVLEDVRAKFKTQILLVTHDLDECFELGDEMFVLDSGRLVQHGPPLEVLRRPASVNVAQLLGRGNILNAEILALDPARNTSRLRCTSGEAQFEIAGHYMPGHLLGDRLPVYVLPEQLTARPRNGNESHPSFGLVRVSEEAGRSADAL